MTEFFFKEESKHLQEELVLGLAKKTQGLYFDEFSFNYERVKNTQLVSPMNFVKMNTFHTTV